MKIFFLQVFFFLSLSAAAQKSIDLFSGSYRYGTPSNLETGSGEAIETGLFFNVKVPIILSEKTIWYTDITHQSYSVNFETSDPGYDPFNVYGFIFQTGLVQQLNENSAFQLLFVPRFMSDFQNVDSRHFQFGGIGLFEHTYSDNLTMRYGLLYNTDRFGSMFVPLIYLDWNYASKWSITGMLPIYAKVNYQVNDKLGVGISHFGLVTSYQMGSLEMNDTYMVRKSIDLALYGRYKIIGNLYSEVRAGYALGRTYSQFESGDELDFQVTILSFGDDRTQLNSNFDAGPMLDFRLVYNLPLD